VIRLLDDAGGQNIEIRGEGSLADHLRANGLPLNTRCGQRGVCKGCTVEVVEGPDQLVHSEVRACQLHGPFDGLAIRIPHASHMESGIRIDDNFNGTDPVLDPPLRRLLVSVAPPESGTGGDFLQRLRSAIRVQLEAKSALAIPPGIVGNLSRVVARQHDLQVIIAMDSPGSWRVVRISPAAEEFSILGVAVDIGTTTVVAMLTDLESGEVLARASRLNAQIRTADDVASRIVAAAQPEGIERLRSLVLHETLKPVLADLCHRGGCEARDVVAVALAGNTVMTHLALRLDPASLGQAPFTAVSLEPPALSEHEMQLGIAPDAIVFIVPSVAAYVGGDIVADLFASSALARRGPVLLVDIGTNGEIVLIRDGRMVACATAAGPAFEGAGLLHGCRATDGAIEHVHLEAGGTLKLETIGNKRAVGLCGSGAVDALACAAEAGFINELGRFNKPLIEERFLLRRTQSHGGLTFGLLLCPARKSATFSDILLTEHDIAELLKAKAAIAAGISALLAAEGLAPHDLECVLLAGGFARHMDIPSAIAIGLLPDIPLDRYEIVGNGSLAGAWHCLLDRSALPACREIARMPRVLELNLIPEFEDAFIDNLKLPDLHSNHSSKA